MDSIKVEMRNMTRSAKQLRKNGIVPGSVYGGSLEKDIPIQMPLRSAEQLFRDKLVGGTLYLELDGKQILVQLKDKARDCVSGRIQHVAFEALKADVPVKSVAHIVLRNTELVPGILEQILYEVPFTSLPGDMIDTVVIDLEGMEAGKSMTLEEIPEFRNDAVTVRLPMDSMVFCIREKHAAEDAEAETEV